jgi:hypothetical protein
MQSNIVISGNGVNICNMGPGMSEEERYILDTIRECLKIVPAKALGNCLKRFFLQYAKKTEELPPDYTQKARAVIEIFDTWEEED